MENQIVKYSIFVGDLSITTNEHELKLLFSNFGEIGDVRIMRDKKTGRSLSYGFIDFVHSSAAIDAISNMNGMLYKGRYIRVRWANSKTSKKSQSTNFNFKEMEAASIFVTFRTFDRIVTEELLLSLFSSYGEVIDTTIRRMEPEKNGESIRGYGFVRFPLNENGVKSAFRATAEMSDIVIDNIHFKCKVSHSLEQDINTQSLNSLSLPPSKPPQDFIASQSLVRAPLTLEDPAVFMNHQYSVQLPPKVPIYNTKTQFNAAVSRPSRTISNTAINSNIETSPFHPNNPFSSFKIQPLGSVKPTSPVRFQDTFRSKDIQYFDNNHFSLFDSDNSVGTSSSGFLAQKPSSDSLSQQDLDNFFDFSVRARHGSLSSNESQVFGKSFFDTK